MKIAVTITVCGQIGIDEWKNYYYTKIFDYSVTILEINSWIKTVAPKQSILDAKIGDGC